MIIGLIGNKRTGKTTCSNFLVNDYDFKSIAFADPIKEAMKIAFDLNYEQLDGKLKEVVDERWGLSPRQLFQKFGTDFARNVIGQDVWIRRMKIELSKMKNENIVVSDIRFPNEAIAVKEMGGYLIKICRKGFEVDENSHISEKLIDKIDYDVLIENNDSMLIYHNNIQKIVNMWKKKEKIDLI